MKKLLPILLFVLCCGCNKNDISIQDSISSEEISDEIISDSSTSEETTYHFNKQYKIYINPSVQYNNLYINNLGNEGTHMNDISNILTNLLKSYTNLLVYSNNYLPGLSLKESVSESNKEKVDYHLAIHSNAGGGSGSEIFYTKSSYNFSFSILSSLNEILPYNTRGLKDGSKHLYELKATTASCCLLEVLFHDDEKQANFIINNKKEIAYAIYKGIVSYFINK